MSDFDDLIAELSGKPLDEAAVERLKRASAGSPLRKERDEAIARAEAAETKARESVGKLRDGVFEKLGIKIKPSLLALPDDLDVTSVEAVQKWAVEQELLEAPKTDAAEQEAINRTAGGGSGTKPPATGDEAILQLIKGSTSAADMKAKLIAAGVAQAPNSRR